MLCIVLDAPPEACHHLDHPKCTVCTIDFQLLCLGFNPQVVPFNEPSIVTGLHF